MLSTATTIYHRTKKRNDQLFNVYIMRPLAAVLVAALEHTSVTPNQASIISLLFFVLSAIALVAEHSGSGLAFAMVLLYVSYLFDCADGMLARQKKLASRAGHLFDFFIDELKAILLTAALSARLFFTGGLGYTCERWARGDTRFLLIGLAATATVASAISLTNFVRRPEISGKEGVVEAHYETVESKIPSSALGRAVALAMMFLRFCNHYPSHLWLFAAFNRLDLFFFMYAAINLLYLTKGWASLIVRFGRPGSP